MLYKISKILPIYQFVLYLSIYKIKIFINKNIYYVSIGYFNLYFTL